jgi:DNA-binding CsgD family transcriptional regulator
VTQARSQFLRSPTASGEPVVAAKPPPADRTALVQASFVDVLTELMLRAEKGQLDITEASHDGLAVVLEHAGLRCVLVVQPAGTPTVLSPRESQIARLIADGATNRLIASVLDISLWTVSTHIRRIFAKLGVNSRAEMVAKLFGSPDRTIT